MGSSLGQVARAVLPSAALAALLALLAMHLRPPYDVTLVGPVTVDVVEDGGRNMGGSVSYAAVALAAFGIRACVVTVAGPDADLSLFAGHDVHTIPSAVTLTFEHSNTHTPDGGHQRHLRVTANPARTLTAADVPWRCRCAPLLLLGPLTLDDIDAKSFLEPVPGARLLSMLPALPWALPARALLGQGQGQGEGQGEGRPAGSVPAVSLLARAGAAGGQLVGLIAQGMQRRLDEGGHVLPLQEPSGRLLDGLGPRVSVFLSDVETGVWPAGAVAGVAAASARLLVTQGPLGHTEVNASGTFHFDASPVDRVVDTNGAGDTFATSYMVALLAGHEDPGEFASWAAGRAVMQPQACKPGCAAELLRGEGPWRHHHQHRLHNNAGAEPDAGAGAAGGVAADTSSGAGADGSGGIDGG